MSEGEALRIEKLISRHDRKRCEIAELKRKYRNKLIAQGLYGTAMLADLSNPFALPLEVREEFKRRWDRPRET